MFYPQNLFAEKVIIVLHNRRKLIEQLFLRLVATRSDTNTFYEKVIEEIILTWLKSRDYFKENPDFVGTRPVKNDPHQREVVWALVKGTGKDTVILLHHHDAVDIEDYGKMKNLALRPDELRDAMLLRKQSPQVKADLESGEWIFGRGTADMKAGAAIQLSLVDEFSRLEEFTGNILLLSVPDEESLSLGMLAASELMYDLAREYELEYILAVNSEPYFNNVKNKAIMYEGSVGKIMPIIYVKGVKSHIGDPYNGINPSLILANIQSLTELNVGLCDRVGDDATPPPIWVNLKDRKKAYDASIPDAATGYFNWLSFTRTPSQILTQLKAICEKAIQQTMQKFEQSYLDFCRLTDDEPDVISFEPQVIDYSQLQQMALENDRFATEFSAFQEEVKELLGKNLITLPEAGIRLLEFVADFVDLEGPTVVVAVSGPFYPHVSNNLLENGKRFDLHERVNRLAQELFNISYSSQAYFMGISDLSYTSWSGKNEDIDAFKNNSPGWNGIYRIPFQALQSFKMPVINLGPWGKDLHKVTERVNARDVYERIPEILLRLLHEIFAAEASFHKK